jgi:hypothetical protein
VSDDSVEQPRVKVAAARNVLRRGRDLFEAAENHLVAVRAVSFGEKVFDEKAGPRPTAEIVAVDLNDSEAKLLGIVSITWTRVIRLLLASDPEEWQVGVLREGDNTAVELQPPSKDLDLGEVAERLGRMQFTMAPPRTAQLELPVGDVGPIDVEAEGEEEEEEEELDNGIPF